MAEQTVVTYSEVVAGLKKPGELLLKQWDNTKASAMHMLLGAYDEYLELMQALAAKDKQGIIEEAGDFCFYCEGLLQDLSCNPDDLKIPEEEILQGLRPTDMLDQMIAVLTPIKRHLVYNKPLDLNEAGVGLIRLQALALGWALHNAGSHPEETLKANTEKLTGVRYKGGFSDKAANERKDKQ